MALKITTTLKNVEFQKLLNKNWPLKKNCTFNDTNNPVKIFIYDLYLLHSELQQNTASYPPLKPLDIYQSTCY
jgi:hypothetical protein